MNWLEETTLRPTFIEAQSSFGIMLMASQDYRAVRVEEQFTSPVDGHIDWVRAAKAGIRIYIFCDEDALARNPEFTPFVVGTWSDLEGMSTGAKIHILQRTYGGIMNPLQNLLPSKLNIESSPHLIIAVVTEDEFRSTFGANVFTRRFPKT